MCFCPHMMLLRTVYRGLPVMWTDAEMVSGTHVNIQLLYLGVYKTFAAGMDSSAHLAMCSVECPERPSSSISFAKAASGCL